MIDLGSVNAKLEWARHHFNLVDAEISAWLKEKPYSVTCERNKEHTKFWLRVNIFGNPDFGRWGLMVGDCVTNLRDTLDHLIYGIAGLPTSPNPQHRDRAAFIIRSRPEDFTKDSRTRLGSVPQSVADAVLGFQPFNRPCHLLPPLLQILGELANGNKHKMLTVTLMTPALIDMQFDSLGQVRQKPTFDIYKRNIQDGTVLCIFELPNPDPFLKLNPKSQVGLQVAIKHNPLKGNTAFDADRTSYSTLVLALFREVELVIATIAKLV